MCACYHSRNLTQRAIEPIRIEIALLSHLNADSLAIPLSDQAGADRQRAAHRIDAFLLSWLAALDQHAIELSQNPARNAAIGMFADALSVEPTQQANWDVGRFSTFEPFPAGMQLRFRKGGKDGDVFLPDVIGDGLHELPSWRVGLMPTSTTQSPVGQAQRGKQRVPALLHTTLLLELEVKSSRICSVYSERCTLEDAVRNDLEVRFAPRRGKCKEIDIDLALPFLLMTGKPAGTGK